MIADVQSNSNLSLVARVLQLAGPPDYVRQATLTDAGAGIEKQASYFADPASCLFPIHTKVATYLSRAYFEMQRDELPRSRQQAIEAKIAEMEGWHKIAEDTSRIREVIASERANTPEAIDRNFSRKLASGAIAPKPDALITIARHLANTQPKLAESPFSFTSKWAFNRQFHNMDANLRALAHRYANHKTAIYELSEAVGRLTPRQQVEQLPAIANKMAEFEPNLTVLQRRLAEMPKADAPQVKLASFIFREGDVRSRLCDLHKLASEPLINAPINTPVVGWQDQLESLDNAQQQKLADFLLG